MPAINFDQINKLADNSAMLTIPLSLYIHFPWCVRKCPYCDFNSHAAHGALPEQAYVSALLDNGREFSELLAKRPIHSIFLGGGTPSLFSAAAIEELMAGLKQFATIASDTEITIEVNPGASDCAALQGYRQAGINRVSLGAQSFSARQLKQLGRIHHSDDIHRAVEAIGQAGFKNYNLDIMYALPAQSINDAISDLQQAIACQPTHLSWYQLTIEPNTHFYKHPPANRPDDDELVDLEVQGRALLAKAGFKQYEISAYSDTEHQCQHNLNYWRFGDYLGLGAGAHSKITESQRILRFANRRQPKDYLNPDKTFIAHQQVVSHPESVFELLLNHWRLLEPLPKARLNERLLGPHALDTQLNAAQAQGFIQLGQDAIHVTDLGRQFLNDLLVMFMPETACNGP